MKKSSKIIINIFIAFGCLLFVGGIFLLWKFDKFGLLINYLKGTSTSTPPLIPHTEVEKVEHKEQEQGEVKQGEQEQRVEIEHKEQEQREEEVKQGEQEQRVEKVEQKELDPNIRKFTPFIITEIKTVEYPEIINKDEYIKFVTINGIQYFINYERTSNFNNYKYLRNDFHRNIVDNKVLDNVKYTIFKNDENNIFIEKIDLTQKIKYSDIYILLKHDDIIDFHFLESNSVYNIN